MSMKHKIPLVLPCILVIVFSLIIPAYADVLSFKTDKTFYGKTGMIMFSGTVEKEDVGELVTIVLEDPTGKFVKLLQAYPDIDNKFQKSIEVSKFYTDAGIYNATAFITNKTNGIVIDFDIEKQRPIIAPAPEPESEPKQEENNAEQNTVTEQNSETNNEKTIQEKIKERIEAAKKLKELQTNPTSQTNENTTNHITNSSNMVTNTTSSDVPIGGQNNPQTVEHAINSDPVLLYAVVGLGGVGVAGTVIYNMRKKSKPQDYSSYFTPSEKTKTLENPSTQSEDDYALMILKNRLAKGEITIDEFNELKKALKEP